MALLQSRKPRNPVAEVDGQIAARQQRRGTLAAELEAARKRCETLRGERVALLVDDGNAEKVGTVGRELGDLSGHAQALEEALARIDGELAELAAARVVALRRHGLGELRAAIEAAIGAGQALDAAWEPALASLVDLAEREADVAAVAKRLGFQGEIARTQLAEALTWRAMDHLPLATTSAHGTGAAHVPVERRTSAEAFLSGAWDGLLRRIDQEIGGDRP